MAAPLLDQALAVARSHRKLWLGNLTPVQRAELQQQIAERRGTPEPKQPSTAGESASVLAKMRRVRVGRHTMLLPSTAKYRRLRDSQVLSYYRGSLKLWRVRNGKIFSQPLKVEDRRYLAKEFFNIRS